MKVLLSWLNDYGDFADPADADGVARIASVLTALPRGRSLWKVAGRTAVVQHVIGAHERHICDTDTNLAI